MRFRAALDQLNWGFEQFERIDVVKRGDRLNIPVAIEGGVVAQLTPVAAPIALLPASAVNPIEFGRIAAGHHCYEPYRKALRRTLEEPFALFLPV